jgi:MFS family permease
MSSSFEPEAAEASERSLAELFSAMTSELSTLFQQQVALAKAEVKEEASKAGQAVSLLAVAGILGLVGALMLTMALAFAIGDLLENTWLGFLIVGAVLAIVAFVLLQSGRKRLQTVNPTPERSIETLKEDMQTIKERRP